jgi:hypothetical protein
MPLISAGKIASGLDLPKQLHDHALAGCLCLGHQILMLNAVAFGSASLFNGIFEKSSQ